MAFDKKRGDLTEREFMILCGRNACRSLTKKRARRHKIDKKKEEILCGIPTRNTIPPVDVAEAKEIYKEIKSLDPKSFNIIHMRIFDNMSFQEIANAYECSKPAVREVYYKGVDRIRRRFEKEC